MLEIGLVVASAVGAGVILAVILVVPSLLYLRTIDRVLNGDSVPGPFEQGPRVRLELLPVFGLYWRFRNVAAIDGRLRLLEKEDEAIKKTRKARLGWQSCVARVVAYLSLTVFLRLLISSDSIPDESILADIAIFALLAFIFVLAYDIFVWSKYWRRLSRLVHGKPIEPHFPGIAVNASTTPALVTEACERWAKEARWRSEKGDATSLSFWPKGDWMADQDKRVEVQLQEAYTGTRVLFLASLSTSYTYPWQSEFWKGDDRRLNSVANEESLAGSFARAVCSDLSARGVSVSPPDFALMLQDRERVKRIAKYRALTPAFTAVGVLAWMLCLLWVSIFGEDAFVSLFVPMVLVILGDLNQTIQDRALGLHSRLRLGFFSFLVVALLIGMAVSAYFVWRG